MSIDHQTYRKNVQGIYNDLLGIDLGTPAQRRAALRSLWTTYLSAWLAYIYFGDLGDAASIDAQIQGDAAHPWLDTLIGGVSIRDRIVARLGEV